VRRVLLACGFVLAAIIAQVTVLDNLPLPGGSPPDLILVAVVTLALAGGPQEGAVIGFAAGLAADIAPPASHFLGENALVFCLVGYGCGLMREPLEHASWLPLAGVGLGVAGGESLHALTGVIFGDPDITWLSVRQVLPPSLVFDLMLSPFVLYAVLRLGRYGEWGTEGAPAGLLTGREMAGLAASGAAVLSGFAGTSGVVRDTGTGRVPQLKAGAHRADGWIGGGQRRPGQSSGAWVDRPRPLRLRLRGGVAGSAAGGPASRPGPARLLPAVPLRLGSPRRRDGVIGGGAVRATFSGSGGTSVRPGGAARLRGSAFSGNQPAAPAGSKRRSRGPRFRIRSRQHGGGVVGGGVLGRKRSGAAPGARAPGKGTFSGSGGTRGAAARMTGGRAPRASSFGGGRGRASPAAFLTRRQPGSAGAFRSGRAYGAEPRFRAGGRRGLGRLRARPGRRSAVWRIGGRGTGGLA
jgi:rod shape-determining protein MreD